VTAELELRLNQPSVMEKKLLPIIFNPSAGGGRAQRHLGKLRRLLNQFGIAHEIIVSESEAHLCELTRSLAQQRELIVGAGGDSTFHLMANEIIRAGGQAALGLIGLGSSNDIPREFGLTTFDRSLSALQKGQVRKIDLAAIVYEGQVVRHVLGQVNVGLGVAVNEFVASLSSRHRFFGRWQSLAGLLGVIHAFRRHLNLIPLSIQTEKARYQGMFAAAVFSNLRFWATGRLIAASATPDDGCFDLFLLPPISLFSLLRVAYLAQRGKNIEDKNVPRASASSFLVSSSQKFRLQADGEIVKRAGQPLELDHFQLKVIPRCLKIIA